VNIRKATIGDREDIAEIYRAIARSIEGIARRPHEITDTYVYSLLNKKPSEVVFLVAVDEDDRVVGAVHGIKNGLEMYSHILSELTVLVRPDMQSKGIGHKLSFAFLDHVFNCRPDVMRVEMEVIDALDRCDVYEAVGFVKEGMPKNRIRRPDGTFSDSVLMAWHNPNFKA
jgi:RimJ/RimL family protein N-acetyltransferase